MIEKILNALNVAATAVKLTDPGPYMDFRFFNLFNLLFGESKPAAEKSQTEKAEDTASDISTLAMHGNVPASMQFASETIRNVLRAGNTLQESGVQFSSNPSLGNFLGLTASIPSAVFNMEEGLLDFRRTILLS
jgi:hypothetical protein